MNAVLYFPKTEDDSQRERKLFSVLVAYEDAITLSRSQHVCQRLRQELGADLEIECLWVKFESLQNAELAGHAVQIASEADLVIFSAHAGKELPEFVKDWIEIWLPAKNHQESALAALVGLPEDLQQGLTPIHVYLSEAAQRAHIDFLSHVVKPQSEPLSYSMEKINERAEKRSPILEELLHSPPPPHWGINE